MIIIAVLFQDYFFNNFNKLIIGTLKIILLSVDIKIFNLKFVCFTKFCENLKK